MVDVLTMGDGLLSIAESWEEQAEVLEVHHTESDVARVLRQCASTVRRHVETSRPDEVSMTTVKDRTGWSDSWLRRRVKTLAEQGRARKRGREWYLDRDAALQIPVKRGHEPPLTDSGSLIEMADRLLDRQDS